MIFISFMWSFIVSWQLTRVGLSSTPIIYGVTRGFEAVSGKWEGKSNHAGEAAEGVFAEAVVNITTVKVLTLEEYFHYKHSKASGHALKVGKGGRHLQGSFSGLRMLVLFSSLVRLSIS